MMDRQDMLQESTGIQKKIPLFSGLRLGKNMGRKNKE
jgi:hypothetical protein